MDVFAELSPKNYEQIIFCHDGLTGLKAIIAIHDTTLGPALGGCRMWPYPSTAEAVRDVLRLARGMTFKSAAAGLNLGGGKAVIIGDPKRDRSEKLFRSFGRYIDGLGGRYITAEDSGTDVRTMEWVRMETNWVTGISRALGGSGDPSPVTAFGTFAGIRASAKVRWGRDSLAGKRVAMQGAGAVGYHLCRYLTEAGAKVTVCDLYEENLKAVVDEFGVEVVPTHAIFDVSADILAPCALGGVINDDTVKKLKVEIVAGPANNILDDQDRHGAALETKNILYAPDYVINSGGLINVANELEGYNQERALKQAEGIYDIMLNVFRIAAERKIPTFRAADELALDRIRSIGQVKSIYSASTNQRPPRRLAGIS
ncbi:MAG: Glu/Leu/Phe/Val dehydrogenase dimerization domain-containing protein [Myxococcota bacterium]